MAYARHGLTADFCKVNAARHSPPKCMLSHAIQCYWRFESPGWTFQWRKFIRNDAQWWAKEEFLETWAIQQFSNSWLSKGAPCYKSWWAHGSPAGEAEMQINSAVNGCAMSPAVLFEPQHGVHVEPWNWSSDLLATVPLAICSWVSTVCFLYCFSRCRGTWPPPSKRTFRQVVQEGLVDL